MKKHTTEFILILILIPILTYVGWQIYNTYLKKPSIDIDKLENPYEEVPSFESDQKPESSLIPEKADTEQKRDIKMPASQKKDIRASQKKQAPNTLGTLDYTGYQKKDPLKPALPVKIKKQEKEIDQKKKEERKIIADEKRRQQKKVKPPKKVVLPKFTITGIVWGTAPPRAIIDGKVYKIGDIIKGAKILSITQKGIQFVYKNKYFLINVQ